MAATAWDEGQCAVDHCREEDLEKLNRLIAGYSLLALSPFDLQKVNATELDYSLNASP
jgi:hypothetical protein